MAVQAPRLEIRISLGPRPRGWLRNPSFPWQPLGKTLLSLLNFEWVTDISAGRACCTVTDRRTGVRPAQLSGLQRESQRAVVALQLQGNMKDSKGRSGNKAKLRCVKSGLVEESKFSMVNLGTQTLNSGWCLNQPV